MWLKIFLFFWTIHSNPFRCSLVIDRAAQEGIYLDDYCPKMPFCPEGAHTMCMYYNPSRVSGPRCSSFQNISVTAEIADHLLGMVNEMRGRVAMGKETGKGNVTLPRGYGIFQLKWDNELATFAQVLANTCILRRDLCRATKKFPDPGQLASLVRFTIPDWLPVSHQKHFTEKGLTPSKISYATNEAYKVWYRDKQHVTLEMIKEAPDWLTAKSTEGRLFLHLVDGKATHMGCGVSAYVEYKFHGSNPNQIIFNSVHIICNFSSQPKKGTAVYRTEEPTAEDLCPPGDRRCISRYSSKCGCPPDTAEDDRCLCTDPLPVPEVKSCQKDKSCKPAVVLLPIFTVEDAPQHMISRKGMSEDIKSNPMYDERQPANSNEWEHNEVLEKYRRKSESDYNHIRKPVTHETAPSCDHKKQSLMDNNNSPQSSYIMNSIEPPYTKMRVAHLDERESDEENDRFRNKQTHQEIKHDNVRNQLSRRESYNERYQPTHRESIEARYDNDNIRNKPNRKHFNEEQDNIRNPPKHRAPNDEQDNRNELSHREYLNKKHDNIREQQIQQESFEENYDNIRNKPNQRESLNEERENTRNQQKHRESFDEKNYNSRDQSNHREFIYENHDDNSRKQQTPKEYFDEKHDYFQNQKEQRKSFDETRDDSLSQTTQRQYSFPPAHKQQTRKEPVNKGIISSRRYTKNKQSVFSRAPRFELHDTGKQTKNSVKMDVAPRKDFSNAKQALDKYLNEKRQKDPTAHDEVQNVDQSIDDIKPDTNKVAVTIRPRFKNSVISSKKHVKKPFDRNITRMTTMRPSMKQYLKNKFQHLGFNINDEALNQVDDNNDIKESDRKLMSLLDNLEQEAQHVNLNGNEKEIFDAKLKKIYGSIAKKTGIVIPKANKLEFSEEEISNFKDIKRHDKANKLVLSEEEISNFKDKKRHDKSLRYESDYDDAMFYDNTDDPNKDEMDKQIYDAEDVINDFHSKDHDMSLQSLYARPLPRDQNTLRPILKDKADYVFRNTFNDVDDFKSKLSIKELKRNNHRGMSKFLENKRLDDDEVKTLPYKIQYNKKKKRQKYAGLNKYKEKKHRQDDENNRHLNQIEEQRVRYEEEIMSDYEDDKPVHFNNKNDKPYGQEYEKEYPEDPLSAERRRFYQEKLDKLKRRKYSPDLDKPGYNRDTGRKRRLLRGLRRTGSGASRRYYLPNRASHHGFKK